MDIDNDMCVVRMPLTSFNAYCRIATNLRDFESTNQGPTGSHINLPERYVMYRFDNAGEALSFGSLMRNATSVTYRSRDEFPTITTP